MICDLAETYHILNYRELPPLLVATFVLGLRGDSRVKMRISESKLSVEQILLAMIVDNLNFQSWTYTKDARKGKTYKEKSVLKTLNGEYEEKKDDLISFETAEEFEQYMSQFIK